MHIPNVQNHNQHCKHELLKKLFLLIRITKFSATLGSITGVLEFELGSAISTVRNCNKTWSIVLPQ